MKTIDQNHFLLKISINKKNPPNEYPYNIPSIKNLNKINFHPKVTFLIGENGTGKSTILEAIAISLGFNPEGGSRNLRFKTKDSHSELYKYIDIKKGLSLPKDGYFLRAETFYNVATSLIEQEFEFSPSYGGKSLHEQSHGESFMSLIENRFLGNGIYILDEPEGALSPFNQLKLLCLIQKLVNKNSQFIIATHSPIILGYPNADIYTIEQEGITKVNYEDTTIYQLTKQFLNNRKPILDELLKV